MVKNLSIKKIVLLGIFISMFFPFSSIFSANPISLLSIENNILDPGAINTPWGGCGPFDSNCYFAKKVTNKKTTTRIIDTPPAQKITTNTLNNQNLISALRNLLSSNNLPSDILSKLKGPKGDKGDVGISTVITQNSNPLPSSYLPGAIIPPNYSTGYSGGSLLGVTDLSSTNLITTNAKITTLNVIGNSNMTGSIDIGGSATVGSLTTSGYINVAGDTTLGDVVTDTVTINSGALSIPNNLNIDSNTLFIDSTNNKIGIGTTAPGELLSLGSAGSTKGVLSLAGNTSGKITIQPAAAAGTYTLTLPTTDGDASQVLTTDGSGVLSWASAGSSGANTALSNLASVAINTSLLPSSNDAIDLGSDTLRWRDAYLGAETVHIGTSTTDEGYLSYTTSTNVFNMQSTGNISLQPTSGNVGIGTTAPTYKFDLVGDFRMTGQVYDINGANSIDPNLRRLKSANSSTSVDYANRGLSDGVVGSLLTWTNPTVAIYPATASDKGLIVVGRSSQTGNLQEWQDSSGNALSVVNASGNIGIGTTSPGYKFDTVGTAVFHPTNGSTIGQTTIGTSSSSAKFLMNDASANQNVQILASGNSYFNGGNVGIGTTSPQYKLDVNGTLGITGNSTFAGILTVNNLLNQTATFSGTNSIQQIQDLVALSSGIVANGFGLYQNYQAETTDGNAYSMGSLQWTWTDATTASRTSSFGIATRTNAGTITPRLLVSGNGDITLGSVAQSGTGNLYANNATFAGQILANAGTAAAPGIVNSSNSSYGFVIGSSNIGIVLGGGYHTYFDASGLTIKETGLIGFSSSGGATNSPDVRLYRDAANTLAQRNSTNAQAFKIYNTYTDASNYERGGMDWASNELLIGTFAKAGTGTNRYPVFTSPIQMYFSAGGTTRYVLGSDGTFAPFANNVYDLGSTGGKFRSGYFGTNVEVGGAVGIGGATIGTNALAVTGTAAVSGDVSIGTTYKTIIGRALQSGEKGLSISYGTKLVRIEGGEYGVESYPVAFMGGSVGIGTTSPQDKLHITTTSGQGLTLDRTGTTDDQYSDIDFTYGDHAYWISKIRATKISGGGGNLQFFTSTNANEPTIPDLTILRGGNVGIGTTAPGAKLDVVGDIISRYADGSAYYVKTLSDGANGFINSNRGYLRLSGQSGTGVVVDSTGNVGIGTTVPGTKLVLSGTQGVALEITDLQVANASWRLYPQTGNTTKLFRIADYGTGSAVDRLVIDSSGNVGIGTTAPGATLDIRSSTVPFQWGSAAEAMGQFNYASGNPTILAVGGKTLSLGANSTKHVTIDTSGNVGIGTTSPSTKLHVLGGITSGAPTNNGTSGLSIKQATDAVISGLLLEASGSQNNGGIYYNNSVLMLREGGVDTLAVDGGNVGIGTTNPGNKLEIVDLDSNYPIKLTESASANNSLKFGSTQVIMNRANGSNAGLEFVTSNSGSWGASGGYIALRPNSSAGLYVLNSGNVGIGTTSPLAKLDVNGSSRFTAQASSTLTGTADPTASTTLTGTGTLFLTELVLGDRIVINSEWRTVTAIASNTSLTVDQAFTDTASASITRLPAVLTAKVGSAVRLALNDLGNLSIGGAANNKDFSISDTYPELEIFKTNATANQGRWTIDAGTDGQLNFYTYNDANSVSGSWMKVVRSGTTASYVAVGPKITNSFSVTPLNAIDISGGGVFGSSYAGVKTAPTNGLLIEGAVGIGTTSPAQSLHVLSLGNTPVEIQGVVDSLVNFDVSGTSKGYVGFTTLGDDGMAFLNSSGTTANLLVTDSGRTGIGTDVPVSWAKLDVGGIMNVQGYVRAYAGIYVGASAINPGNNNLFVEGNVGIGTTTPGGKLVIKGTGSTTGIGFQTQNSSGAPLITMIDSGNLGIGTTAPGSKLEVIGDIVSTGTSWTSRTVPAANSWKSITYGNGLFVAVSTNGSGNRVMTSSDGVTWTSRTSASDQTWYSVTYGSGLFVAVGGGTTYMTSPDGINWTSRTLPYGMAAITYGNNTFVAVTIGSTNAVLTSPDGINWTARNASVSGSWASVTYGNNTFVAVNNSINGTANHAMTSPDGVTWTTQSSIADTAWYGLTYGNGLFVAVGSGGPFPTISTSPDGVTWTARSSPNPNSTTWNAVTYGNGLFVVVGTNASVATSPDGITWTVRTSAGSGNGWNGIAYGNGIFAAVQYSAGATSVMTSGKAQYSMVATNNIYQGGMTIFGNVGIGTTAPLRLFSVQSADTRSSGFNDIAQYLAPSQTGGAVSVNFGIANSTYNIGKFAFNYVGSGSTSNYLGLGFYDKDNVLTVQASGNVGIGTTAPQVPLQIGYENLSPLTRPTSIEINGVNQRIDQRMGNVSILTNSTYGADVGGSLGLGGAYSSSGSIAFALISGRKENATANNYAGYLQFATQISDGTMAERMRITSTGNVGIGTTSPSAPLEVKGTGTGATIAKFTDVNTTGCTLATGGTIACSSDVRLKKNIEDISYGLETLLSLRPVLYNWNYEVDGSAKSLGFIAQEVESIIPKLVSTDTEGMKSLNTTGMIPMVVRSIQELNLSINSISGTITPLEGSASETFAKVFFDNVYSKMRTWLASAENGIQDFYANRMRTKELCIGDDSGETCITKTQLDTLLANAGMSAVSTSTPSSNEEGAGGGNSSDAVVPVITLNGEAIINLNIGDTYNEEGATALDDVDGNVAVIISGSVDTNTNGSYTITYSATDIAGNNITTTRIVNVVDLSIVTPLLNEGGDGGGEPAPTEEVEPAL